MNLLASFRRFSFLILALLPFMAGAATLGTIPAGMSPSLSLGLFEDTGNSWMKNSGVPWNIRYRYLTYRWSSNWGFGAKDGSFALDFFRETGTQGFIPAISYYEIYDLPWYDASGKAQGGHGQLEKMQNKASMTEYFQDFKLLMQRAKDYGKPVLVMVEPDATGFAEGETGGNPATAAIIAATGMPELQGLPNTVAGWGLAFLQVRRAVGASNVILGMHVSGWATGQDLFYFDTNVNLQTAVDQAAAFLGPLGLATNVTGSTYDVLVGDPLDRDSDYYKLVRGEDRWWDASDTAPINSKSFNRYAEWMRLWNVKSGRRWVLWQIPLGNPASRNVCNNGTANSGYADNRVDYFLGTSSGAHLKLFTDNGAIALLFGQGEDCQTTQQTDGNNVRNRAQTFYAAGGLLLPGAQVPVVDAGTPVVDAGTPATDAGTPVTDAGTSPAADVAQYNFETGLQGFAPQASGSSITTASSPVWSGQRSLAIDFLNSGGTQQFQVANPATPRGATVTYHLWLPAGAPLASVQVYGQETQATGWKWNSHWYPGTALTTGWQTLTVTMPTVKGTLQALGIQFEFTKAWTGTVYVDSISWGSGTADAGTPTNPTDAGTPVVDAGTPVVDAGVPDAGTPPTDAGTPVVDAGTPATDAGTPAPGKLPRAFRIHTIGDSTTESVDSSFRCAMYTSLVASGYQPTFVGTLTHPYGCTEANRHDGHAGVTAEDIATGMPAWIKANTPDVIIYSSGTNTYRWWTTETGDVMGARQDGFIGALFTAAPNAVVIVWTIPLQSLVTIPPNGQNSQTVERAYNAQIRKAVARYQAQGKKIVLVDLETQVTGPDLYDGVHPTFQAGQNKMAPAFLAALRPWLP